MATLFMDFPGGIHLIHQWLNLKENASINFSPNFSVLLIIWARNFFKFQFFKLFTFKNIT